MQIQGVACAVTGTVSAVSCAFVPYLLCIYGVLVLYSRASLVYQICICGVLGQVSVLYLAYQAVFTVYLLRICRVSELYLCRIRECISGVLESFWSSRMQLVSQLPFLGGRKAHSDVCEKMYCLY